MKGCSAHCLSAHYRSFPSSGFPRFYYCNSFSPLQLHIFSQKLNATLPPKQKKKKVNCKHTNSCNCLQQGIFISAICGIVYITLNIIFHYFSKKKLYASKQQLCFIWNRAQELLPWTAERDLCTQPPDRRSTQCDKHWNKLFLCTFISLPKRSTSGIWLIQEHPQTNLFNRQQHTYFSMPVY